MNFNDNIRKWPVKVRLYPEPSTSSLYCLAYIWPNHKSLVKGYNSMPYANKYNKITKHQDKKIVAGVTVPIFLRYKKGNRLSPVFAHIHLSAEYLLELFTSHEILHAAIDWQIRAKLNPAFMFKKQVTKDEERFCYGYANMLWQLTCRLNKLGLYK
jgi:hypothetical protein